MSVNPFWQNDTVKKLTLAAALIFASAIISGVIGYRQLGYSRLQMRLDLDGGDLGAAGLGIGTVIIGVPLFLLALLFQWVARRLTRGIKEEWLRTVFNTGAVALFLAPTLTRGPQNDPIIAPAVAHMTIFVTFDPSDACLFGYLPIAAVWLFLVLCAILRQRQSAAKET